MGHYKKVGRSSEPALIIFLIDSSATMNIKDRGNGKKRRIDIVREALFSTLENMVVNLTKSSGDISPAYHIAMCAYNDEKYDLYGGIRTIGEVFSIGVPVLQSFGQTNQAAAFFWAKQLLEENLHKYMNCPAPLVCHLTDGLYTGENPLDIAKSIKEMRVHDGNVLVENIFISPNVLDKPLTDDKVKSWNGVLPDTQLNDPYTISLQKISSPIPESYHKIISQEFKYGISPHALLMFPGTSYELVKLGFTAAIASGAK